jgi:hypothetical protein
MLAFNGIPANQSVDKQMREATHILNFKTTSTCLSGIDTAIFYINQCWHLFDHLTALGVLGVACVPVDANSAAALTQMLLADVQHCGNSSSRLAEPAHLLLLHEEESHAICF